MAFRYPLRLAWFFAGLAIVAFGYAMIIKPGFGAAPWDIFHLGVSGKSGLPLGFVVQGIGVIIIGLNALLHIKPTVGMVLNMLCYGPLLQFMLSVLPVPDSLAARWLMLAAGITVAGLGTAIYVSAGLGAGPRDGLMLGLTRMLGLPVAVVKNGMDVTVALAGWWLGGPLGLATVIVALGIGPAVQMGMYVVERLSHLAPFSGFVTPVALRRG